jgi:serine-aspartate repeat-containing protein C/D/E
LLKDASGNVLQTAVTTNSPTTGAPGYYNFTVDPGTYIVMVMAPTGTTISPNGPVNPTTGNTSPITVTSGSTNTTTDAGLYQAARIGNYVWFDTDKDGVQDGSESGINGFVVNLYNAANTV